jgi:hypothetical protein
MSSKRGMRRRRCTGKRRYETAAHAAFDAAALSRQQREHLEPYRCPHCGGIHVGHVPRVRPAAPAGRRAR